MADKLNLVVWAFSLFSVLILLWVALSWHRKKRLSLLFICKVKSESGNDRGEASIGGLTVPD